MPVPSSRESRRLYASASSALYRYWGYLTYALGAALFMVGVTVSLGFPSAPLGALGLRNLLMAWTNVAGGALFVVGSLVQA